MRLSPRAQVSTWLLGAGLLGVFLAVGRPNPAFFPPCPVHALTGLHCPGCGTTRAFLALGRGEFALAWHNNPLALLALVFLVPLGLRQAWHALRENRFATIRPPRLAGPVVMWTVILFTVFRNLPWPPFAWLAPVG